MESTIESLPENEILTILRAADEIIAQGGRNIINILNSGKQVDRSEALERQKELDELLQGSAPHDLWLKCWECGERFPFTSGEQKFFKEKGFQLPKRCPSCRQERKFEQFFGIVDE
ncbi:zinc-ribbon domain-containing protein [Lentibacillus sp. N15]|uniref:zinc-ribbon domain-containing protein n=1 Tax=Lentibacillus songyuanensis TaxID=3136161 RepID=UPI0031BA3CC0